MPVDNSSAIGAIDSLKNYVSNCFTKCTEKGSTFSGNQKLANLSTAIHLIPQTVAGGGTTINGASFGGFDVVWGSPDEETYTLNFGSYGTDWKAISCWSDTKDGHFNIFKTSSTHCIISGAYFVDLESEWDENFGIYPMGRGTFRASYSISGSSITFTLAEYDGTSNGFTMPEGFKDIVTQATSEIDEYYTNPYKLDKITVLYWCLGGEYVS